VLDNPEDHTREVKVPEVVDELIRRINNIRAHVGTRTQHLQAAAQPTVESISAEPPAQAEADAA
jgi:hypothetical protein